jgi:hypothetical protein
MLVRAFNAADVGNPAPHVRLYLQSMLNVSVFATHSAVGVNRDVELIMYEKIVAWTLANDPEIIDERLFGAYFRIEKVLSDASTLVFLAGRLANAANPLRLKMNTRVDYA